MLFTESYPVILEPSRSDTEFLFEGLTCSDLGRVYRQMVVRDTQCCKEYTESLLSVRRGEQLG